MTTSVLPLEVGLNDGGHLGDLLCWPEVGLTLGPVIKTMNNKLIQFPSSATYT